MGNGTTNGLGGDAPILRVDQLPGILTDQPGTPQKELAPIRIDAAQAAEDLKDLVSMVVGLSGLFAGLKDKDGNILPEKAIETAQLLAKDAEQRQVKDPRAAARLLQDAVALDPSNLELRVKAAFAWKDLAKKNEKNPEVRTLAMKTGLGFLQDIDTSRGQNPDVANAKFELAKAMTGYCIYFGPGGESDSLIDAAFYLQIAIHNGTPEQVQTLYKGFEDFPHPEVFPLIDEKLHQSPAQFFADQLVVAGRPAEARGIYLQEAENFKDSNPKLSEGMKFLASRIELDPGQDFAELGKWNDADDAKVDEAIDVRGFYKNPTQIDSAKARIKQETESFLFSEEMKGLQIGSADYKHKLAKFIGTQTEYQFLPPEDKKGFLNQKLIAPQEPYVYQLKLEKGDSDWNYLQCSDLQRRAQYYKLCGDELLGEGHGNAVLPPGVQVTDRLKSAIRFYQKSLELQKADGSEQGDAACECRLQLARSYTLLAKGDVGPQLSKLLFHAAAKELGQIKNDQFGGNWQVMQAAGDLCLASGRPSEARQYFMEALNLAQKAGVPEYSKTTVEYVNQLDSRQNYDAEQAFNETALGSSLKKATDAEVKLMNSDRLTGDSAPGEKIQDALMIKGVKTSDIVAWYKENRPGVEISEGSLSPKNYVQYAMAHGDQYRGELEKVYGKLPFNDKGELDPEFKKSAETYHEGRIHKAEETAKHQGLEPGTEAFKNFVDQEMAKKDLLDSAFQHLLRPLDQKDLSFTFWATCEVRGMALEANAQAGGDLNQAYQDLQQAGEAFSGAYDLMGETSDLRNSAKNFYQAATLAQRFGKGEEAKALFLKGATALQFAGSELLNDPQNMKLLGDGLMGAGKYQEAKTAYNTAQEPLLQYYGARRPGSPTPEFFTQCALLSDQCHKKAYTQRTLGPDFFDEKIVLEEKAAKGSINPTEKARLEQINEGLATLNKIDGLSYPAKPPSSESKESDEPRGVSKLRNEVIAALKSGDGDKLTELAGIATRQAENAETLQMADQLRRQVILPQLPPQIQDYIRRTNDWSVLKTEYKEGDTLPDRDWNVDALNNTPINKALREWDESNPQQAAQVRATLKTFGTSGIIYNLQGYEDLGALNAEVDKIQGKLFKTDAQGKIPLDPQDPSGQTRRFHPSADIELWFQKAKEVDLRDKPEEWLSTHLDETRNSLHLLGKTETALQSIQKYFQDTKQGIDAAKKSGNTEQAEVLEKHLGQLKDRITELKKNFGQTLSGQTEKFDADLEQFGLHSKKLGLLWGRIDAEDKGKFAYQDDLLADKGKLQDATIRFSVLGEDAAPEKILEEMIAINKDLSHSQVVLLKGLTLVETATIQHFKAEEAIWDSTEGRDSITGWKKDPKWTEAMAKLDATFDDSQAIDASKIDNFLADNLKFLKESNPEMFQDLPTTISKGINAQVTQLRQMRKEKEDAGQSTYEYDQLINNYLGAQQALEKGDTGRALALFKVATESKRRSSVEKDYENLKDNQMVDGIFLEAVIVTLAAAATAATMGALAPQALAAVGAGTASFTTTVGMGLLEGGLFVGYDLGLRSALYAGREGLEALGVKHVSLTGFHNPWEEIHGLEDFGWKVLMNAGMLKALHYAGQGFQGFALGGRALARAGATTLLEDAASVGMRRGMMRQMLQEEMAALGKGGTSLLGKGVSKLGKGAYQLGAFATEFGGMQAWSAVEMSLNALRHAAHGEELDWSHLQKEIGGIFDPNNLGLSCANLIGLKLGGLGSHPFLEAVRSSKQISATQKEQFKVFFETKTQFEQRLTTEMAKSEAEGRPFLLNSELRSEAQKLIKSGQILEVPEMISKQIEGLDQQAQQWGKTKSILNSLVDYSKSEEGSAYFFVGDGKAPSLLSPSEKPEWRVKSITEENGSWKVTLSNIKDSTWETSATSKERPAFQEGSGIVIVSGGGGSAVRKIQFDSKAPKLELIPGGKSEAPPASTERLKEARDAVMGKADGSLKGLAEEFGATDMFNDSARAFMERVRDNPALDIASESRRMGEVLQYIDASVLPQAKNLSPEQGQLLRESLFRQVMEGKATIEEAKTLGEKLQSGHFHLEVTEPGQNPLGYQVAEGKAEPYQGGNKGPEFPSQSDYLFSALKLENRGVVEKTQSREALEVFLKENYPGAAKTEGLIEKIRQGEGVLTFANGKVHFQEKTELDLRIKAAGEKIDSFQQSNQEKYGKIDKRITTAFLEAVARDPNFPVEKIEARFESTLQGLNAAREGVRAVPKEQQIPVLEELTRELASGNIEVKDIEAASAKGLAQSDISILENKLGTDRGQWLVELSQNPEAFRNNIAYIQTAQELVAEHGSLNRVSTYSSFDVGANTLKSTFQKPETAFDHSAQTKILKVLQFQFPGDPRLRSLENLVEISKENDAKAQRAFEEGARVEVIEDRGRVKYFQGGKEVDARTYFAFLRYQNEHLPLPQYSLDAETKASEPASKYQDANGNLWKTKERADAWTRLTEDLGGKSVPPLRVEDYVESYIAANGKIPAKADVDFFNKKFAGKFLDKNGHPQDNVAARNLVNTYGSLSEVPWYSSYEAGREALLAMRNSPEFALNHQAQRNLCNILEVQFGKEPDPARRQDLEGMKSLVHMTGLNLRDQERAFDNGSWVEQKTENGQTVYVEHLVSELHGQWGEHLFNVDTATFYAYDRYQKSEGGPRHTVEKQDSLEPGENANPPIFFVGEGKAPALIVPSEKPEWRVKSITEDGAGWKIELSNLKDPNWVVDAVNATKPAIEVDGEVALIGIGGGGRALQTLSPPISDIRKVQAKPLNANDMTPTVTPDFSVSPKQDAQEGPTGIVSEILFKAPWVNEMNRLIAFGERQEQSQIELSPREKTQIDAAKKAKRLSLDLVNLSVEIKGAESELSMVPKGATFDGQRNRLQERLEELRATEQEKINAITPWKNYTPERAALKNSIRYISIPFERRAIQWAGSERGHLEAPEGPAILDVSYKTPDLYADVTQGPGKRSEDYTIVLQVRDAKDQARVLEELKQTALDPAKPDADPKNPVTSVQIVADSNSALFTTKDGKSFTVLVEVTPPIFFVGDGKAPALIAPSEKPEWTVKSKTQLEDGGWQVTLSNLADPSFEVSAGNMNEPAFKVGSQVTLIGIGGGGSAIPGNGPAQTAASGLLPTGKLTTINPYIDDRPFVIGREQGDLKYSDPWVSNPHVTIKRNLETGQYTLVNGRDGDPKLSMNGILINGVPMQSKETSIENGQRFALRGSDGKIAYFQFVDPKIPAGRVSQGGFVVLDGQSYHVKKQSLGDMVFFGGGTLFGDVTYGSPIPGDPAGSITLAVSAGPNLDPNSPEFRTRAIIVTAQKAKELGITLGQDGRPLKPVNIQLTPGVEPAQMLSAKPAVAVPLSDPPPPPSPVLRAVPPLPVVVPVQPEGLPPGKVQTILDDHVPGKPRKGEVEIGATAIYGTAAGETHEGIGQKKLGPDPVNEDALIQGQNWAVVLDGMGGMGHGDKASSIPGEAMARYLEQHRNDPDQAKVMEDAFQYGYQALWNSPLYQDIRAKNPGVPDNEIKWPGTVGVAHKVVPDGKGGFNAIIVHVGDAGGVVVDKNGKVKYRTEDQGLAQFLVGQDAQKDGKDPTSPDIEKKKRFHPQGNIVMGSIGGVTPPQPVVQVVHLEPGDRIIMFSDGVGDSMSTTDIVNKALDAKNPKEAQRAIMGSTLEKLSDLDDAIAELKPGKRLPITREDGTTAYVDKHGGIFTELSGGEQIDYYKPDNVTVHVYEHNPQAGDKVIVESEGQSLYLEPFSARKRAPENLLGYGEVKQAYPSPEKPGFIKLEISYTEGSQPGAAAKKMISDLTPSQAVALGIRLTPDGNIAAGSTRTTLTISTAKAESAPMDRDSGAKPKQTPVTPSIAPESLPEIDIKSLQALDKRPHVSQILNDPNLKPVAKVSAQGFTFYISRVIESVGEDGKVRPHVLALVPVNENGRTVLKRRFFYKSNSDGGWRASPYMLMGQYSKGVGVHYTQETQPIPELTEQLQKLEDAGGGVPKLRMKDEDLSQYIDFASPLLDMEGKHTMLGGFEKEIIFPSNVGMTDVRGFQPGNAFKAGKYEGGSEPAVVNRIADLRYPEGFIPDFNRQPSRTYQENHTLLGGITCREFQGGYLAEKGTGRQRPVIWTMAEDSQGRTWVKSIRYTDSKVNSYGVYNEVIDSGIITSKPLEYASQSTKLPKEYRPAFNDEYVDITPALNILKPIRDYRQSRGLANPALPKALAEPLPPPPQQSIPIIPANAFANHNEAIIGGDFSDRANVKTVNNLAPDFRKNVNAQGFIEVPVYIDPRIGLIRAVGGLEGVSIVDADRYRRGTLLLKPAGDGGGAFRNSPNVPLVIRDIVLPLVNFNALGNLALRGKEFRVEAPLPQAEAVAPPPPQTFANPNDSTGVLNSRLQGLTAYEGKWTYFMAEDLPQAFLGREALMGQAGTEMVSRRHVRIFRDNGTTFIEDNYSSHGTQVIRNGQVAWTSRGQSSPMKSIFPIHPGDKIVMAGVEVIFGSSQN